MEANYFTILHWFPDGLIAFLLSWKIWLGWVFWHRLRPIVLLKLKTWLLNFCLLSPFICFVAQVAYGWMGGKPQGTKNDCCTISLYCAATLTVWFLAPGFFSNPSISSDWMHGLLYQPTSRPVIWVTSRKCLAFSVPPYL